MNEAGKLIFVTVVLSGTSLKQVMLEPPGSKQPTSASASFQAALMSRISPL
ncbi:hypothetical protein ACVWZW_003958 [Bradyrhizobium sp. F1.13.4]